MLNLFTNIFKGFNISDAMKQSDDWVITKEEKIKYQLEWLRTMPTGFQLAQRLIGVAFAFVFLLLVMITFGMLVAGRDISKEMNFISATLAQPLMIIFSLFFGGGLLNSIKTGGRSWSQQRAVEKAKQPIKNVFTEETRPISKREARLLRKLEKEESKNGES